MAPVHVLATATLRVLVPLGNSLAATSKKTPNSSFTLIFFVLLFGVGYMFLIRPQRQRRQRQAQASRQISVGDKVMLSSGIIGRVEGFVGDRARVEIAPGTVIEVVRQALTQRIDDVVDADGDHDADSSYDDHDHEDDSDDDDEHEHYHDDSHYDPYSVPPLETGGTADDSEVEDQSHPSGSGSGGGSS